MKILLIDAMFAFVDYAMRAEAEGHEVKVWMPKDKDGTRCTVGDGLIDKVEHWQSWMKWADLILCSDNARYIRELEGWRDRGYPIWGPNVTCTEWELDRGIGQRILEDHGIACIPSVCFSNYDEAISYLTKNPKRYVSKPSGDVDKALSYVSKGPADMLFMLEYWKKNQKNKTPFLFQEFVPGIEMAVGGWMGRDGFLSFFLENFEFKKLMPGEVGVNTGEMGTVMKYCSLEESKLAQQMLMPIESELIRQGYTGYIDVAVIIDEKGNPWPLEFTSRPGWPLFDIQQVLHPNVADWMLDALQGRDTFKPKRDIALGVVMAIPQFPYPTQKRAELTGFPIWGVDKSNRYYVHPCEVKAGMAPVGPSLKREEVMVTAGNYALVVSGTGKTVSKAKDAAYKRVKQIELPNSPIYRIDIGGRLEKQLPKLWDLGYAVSWDWE